jgi:hypothetical protein
MGKRAAEQSPPKGEKQSLPTHKREGEELEATKSVVPSQGGTDAAQGATSSGRPAERYVPV